ncbi:MYG1 family protein [Candidatus Woesearchaeota archaeon]|nr:MYG1 family protein [Candidatus Woesearchaeota archaeon]
MNAPKTIATHDGNFHADDVFAIAILKMIYPDVVVVRTRDNALMEKADLRVDVGFKYDPSTGDFDHHQAGGAGKRANGIEYAACGLIWKHFGQLLVAERIQQRIDFKLIQFIDAEDLGAVIYDEKLPPVTVADLARLFNPLWNEQTDVDACFMQAVRFAQHFIERLLAAMQGEEQASIIVRAALNKSKRKDYIVLEEYAPWKDVIVGESEAKYVVYPALDKRDWTVYAVPITKSSFEARQKMPASWGGKKDEELAKITGVSDAVFCHSGLWIAKAKSCAGAEKLAQLALAHK